MNLKNRYVRDLALGLISAWCILSTATVEAQSAASRATGGSLWAHENLLAWCVVPFDANKRGPEQRAQMLNKLGFTQFAYDWREEHIPTFDAEIKTLQNHKVDLVAWWFPLEADDPLAKSTLETFKRRHVHPQLWVMQSTRGIEKSGLTFEQFNANDFPKTPEEQQQRIEKEADRIAAIAKLAAPYGSKVELYNHNGWFGNMDNEVAVIKQLQKTGITDVGLAYNFNHARDEQHDDSKDFPALWERIKRYVVVVNLIGIGPKGKELYISQGDADLAMLRTIQNSGWEGPIGLIAEQGGDAEITLGRNIAGLDWVAAELRAPGSGGPRPVPAPQ
jgi:sugar phosphate isomerase/epimerase